MLGDFTPAVTIRTKFNTADGTGAPITLAGTPAVKVYKDGSTTTETTTGVTLSVDFDGVVGLHQVAVDTSADGAFYAAGSDFSLILTAGTVNGVSAVGTNIEEFSIRNRSLPAAKLTAHAAGVLVLVCDAGCTTTAIVFKTVDGAAPSAVNSFYKGAVIVFTSGALAGQRTSISAYVGATVTATVVALTGAPADNVTGIIV